MLQPITDGLVTIRPPRDGDAALLIAGRDAEFHRYLGPATDDPSPIGCVEVGGEVVGWVDHDTDRAWLEPGEVNLGYNVFAAHRGRGHASRAVQLLLHHLAVDTGVRVATLLIHPQNHRSLALGARTGFVRRGDLDGVPYLARPVPPLAYTAGDVTVRFTGSVGPRWTFALDGDDVATVDCDPAGDATISVPAQQEGAGDLLVRFLRDHTGVRNVRRAGRRRRDAV